MSTKNRICNAICWGLACGSTMHILYLEGLSLKAAFWIGFIVAVPAAKQISDSFVRDKPESSGLPGEGER